MAMCPIFACKVKSKNGCIACIIVGYNIKYSRQCKYEERKQNMNIEELVEVHECPVCGGAGLLEEECGSSYYVMCTECGAHSVNIDFKTEEERLTAAQKTAMLWNTGKVIKSEQGE